MIWPLNFKKLGQNFRWFFCRFGDQKDISKLTNPYVLTRGETSSVKTSNISGVRCLETGITEVRLNVDAEAMEKDKMKTFVEEVRNTGLMLREPREYYPNNPFYGNEATAQGARIKPWEIVDE